MGGNYNALLRLPSSSSCAIIAGHAQKQTCRGARFDFARPETCARCGASRDSLRLARQPGGPPDARRAASARIEATRRFETAPARRRVTPAISQSPSTIRRPDTIRSMSKRFLAAVSLAIVTSVACGGISSPSQNQQTPFSGVLQVGGSAHFQVDVANGGEYSVRI